MTCNPSIDGLRVAVVTTSHDVSDARVRSRISHGLSGMGARVDLIGPDAYTLRDDSVRIVALPVPRSRLERFTVQPLRALRAVLRGQYDVVHVHDPEALILGPIFLYLFIRHPRLFLLLMLSGAMGGGRGGGMRGFGGGFGGFGGGMSGGGGAGRSY